MDIPKIHPVTSLSSDLRAVLQGDTNKRLQSIIGANINTRFATSSSALADFRLAIADKDVQNDTAVLFDFRHLVPPTRYDSYSPLITKFIEHPCNLSEAENLLAPGLPRFFCFSSSTSGSPRKYFPRYYQSLQSRHITENIDAVGSIVSICYLGHRKFVELVSQSGEIVHKVPIAPSFPARSRTTMNWSPETDDTRMTLRVPGHTAPWATSLITNPRSFLLIHALFALADSNVEQIRTIFVPLFMDMIYRMQEEWDLLITCIRNGTIPDIEHIDHIRSHLQIHLYADPQRAEELQNIGPPFSCPSWAQRAWPKLSALVCICSGRFSIGLPKARTLLGPNITIHNPGYVSTEGLQGEALNFGDIDTFSFESKDVVEFLSITGERTHAHIVQAWDLQLGKQYQPVYTSRDGLWRYLIDDMVEFMGFDPRNGSPVFRHSARTGSEIQLPCGSVTEADLLSVVRAISSKDILEVDEFTATIDRRELPATVCFFFEVSGPLGPNSHLSRQKAFEALVATNSQLQSEFDQGQLRLPTIRIVRPGAFTEFRRWRGESKKVGLGQLKLPVVMMDPESLEWVAETVVTEL